MATREGQEGNLYASFGEKPDFMLKPGASKELRIVPRFEGGVPLEIRPQSLVFSVWWRRGNATWLRQFPVRVRTSTSIIRQYGLEKPAPSV
jgi:hypothetical protein